MTSTEPADLYQVLGVAPEADEHLLDQAFRTLARRHHPDMRRQHDDLAGPATKAHTEPDSERFQEILAAYAVLRDPVARVAYDRTIQHGGAAATRPSPASSPTEPITTPRRFEPPLHAGPVRWTPSTPRPSRPTVDGHPAASQTPAKEAR